MVTPEARWHFEMFRHTVIERVHTRVLARIIAGLGMMADVTEQVSSTSSPRVGRGGRQEQGRGSGRETAHYQLPD
jgi:hypothetical protein